MMQLITSVQSRSLNIFLSAVRTTQYWSLTHKFNVFCYLDFLLLVQSLILAVELY